MSTKKLLRETQRALEADGLTIVEHWSGHSAHLRMLVADREGRQAQVTMACSPSCHDHAVREVVRRARFKIRATAPRGRS